MMHEEREACNDYNFMTTMLTVFRPFTKMIISKYIPAILRSQPVLGVGLNISCINEDISPWLKRLNHSDKVSGTIKMLEIGQTSIGIKQSGGQTRERLEVRLGRSLSMQVLGNPLALQVKLH